MSSTPGSTDGIHVVLDFTRIDSLYSIYSVLSNITHNEDNVSALINYKEKRSDKINDYLSLKSQTPYNLYGYGPVDFKGNTIINYSRDLARISKTHTDAGSTNKYSNYKYAYHYPVLFSNWNKFSRCKNDDYRNYSIYTTIYTKDSYSFLSIFDSTDQYNNNIYNEISLDRIDQPPTYHGRNIYINSDLVYLKINNNIYTNINLGRSYKYMIIELDGTINKSAKLGNIFRNCTTHAYVLTNPNNRLTPYLPGLLANCSATKFGDPSDDRTLLNMTDINDISYMCSNSNIEDMSMHKISFGLGHKRYYMDDAFKLSKIKKLPTGLVESLGRGYADLSLRSAFDGAKNIEIDISKINIPTLGTSPSDYNVSNMYENSNCRHINRSIISRNDGDYISANYMYKDTTLVEDTPLPDGMFKNYKRVDNMFKNTTFETTDTFKYIYTECAKNTNFADKSSSIMPFINIGIINSKENSNIDVSGDNLSLIPFIIDDTKSKDSKYYNINITGFRSFENRLNAIIVVAHKCKELRYGCSYNDLKTISTKDQFNNKYGGLFLGFDDLCLSSNDDRSGVPAFFKVNMDSNTVLDLFREIRLMLISDDYYRLYNKIFEGIFEQNLAPKNNRGKNTTAVLFSNTNTSIEMLSLDELKQDKYTGILLSRYITDSACAIVNTNGKNLRWTLSKYHYDLYNGKYEYNIFDAYRYYAYISVFNNVVHLRRAILTQMYFTKSFENEKIEFIFRAKDIESLKEFMALMSQYMSTADDSKPVGRYLLLYNNATYDSKTDMDSINRLVTGVDLRPYIIKLNEDTSVPSE